MGDRPRPRLTQAPSARRQWRAWRRNAELFLAHGVRPIGAFVPDVAALRGGAPRIIVAGGEASGDQLPYRAALALAEQLGTTVVDACDDIQRLLGSGGNDHVVRRGLNCPRDPDVARDSLA
jgi:hypothetical protein